MNKIKNWIVGHKKTSIAIGVATVLIVAIGSIIWTFNARQVADTRKTPVNTSTNTKVVETKKDASGKEVKVEVVKDANGNVVSEKPVDNNAQGSTTSTTNNTASTATEETTQETRVDDNTTKKVIKVTEVIPFSTVDNYASTGAESRVYQDGSNGQKEIRYEITYKNGTEINRQYLGETVTVNPTNKIIERYVEVTPRKVTTQEVEDKNQPIYRTKSVDRWFVKDRKGNLFLFYSAKEAEDKYLEIGRANWGTYEPETVKTDIVIGYEKVTKEVVQEATYAWKH